MLERARSPVTHWISCCSSLHTQIRPLRTTGTRLQSRHQWGQRRSPSNREGLAEDAYVRWAVLGEAPSCAMGVGAGLGGYRLRVPAVGSSWAEGHTWCGTGCRLGGGDKAQGSVGGVFFSSEGSVGPKVCFVTGYLTKQGYRGQGQASACRAKAERKTGRSALLPVYEQA